MNKLYTTVFFFSLLIGNQKQILNAEKIPSFNIIKNEITLIEKINSVKKKILRQRNSSEIVLIDSSLNGYGLINGATTPISYIPGNGFVLGYRQLVPSMPDSSGFIGMAFSSNGNNFTTFSLLNLSKPAESMGRYPSAVGGPDYPYVFWNEYTQEKDGARSGGGSTGGRPLYTWDEFQYNGGSFYSPPQDLNTGCKYPPCNPPDNWTGSISLSLKNEIPVINGLYTQYSSANSDSVTANRWLFHSQENNYGLFDFISPTLLFSDDDLESSFTSSGVIDINDKGEGYAVVSSYLKDVSIDSSHTLFIRKTNDFGESWSGEESDLYYFVSSSVLREKFYGNQLFPSNVDTVSLNNVFTTYEVDVISDPIKGVHVFATVIPSSQNAIYPAIDSSCGIYHFFSDDPSIENNWDVNFVTSLQSTFIYDENWKKIYPSSAISIDNSDIIYVSFMAISDTSNNNINYDVFVTQSKDKGRSWSEPKNITNSIDQDEMYPQLAKKAHNDEAYLIFQSPDYSYRSVFQEDGSDPKPEDHKNLIYFTKAKFNQLSNSKNIYIPDKISLEQNFPNPFNPATSISFSLPKSDFVNIKIYDILGNQVDQVTNKFYDIGNHIVSWNGQNFSAGLYFYVLETSNQHISKKMILLK